MPCHLLLGCACGWIDAAAAAAAAAIIAAIFVVAVTAAANNSDVVVSSLLKQLTPWQQCSIFLAPSSSGGFGVFAARDFEAHEIVEMSAFFIPAPYESALIHNTALLDYTYGYWERPEVAKESMAAILWGAGMIYNHHPESHNIIWTSFGDEPYDRNPHSILVMAFEANRRIEKGEELFATYGSEDGGVMWFFERHLNMTTAPIAKARIPEDRLQEYQELYCSKIYADMDDFVFYERLQPFIRPPQFYHPSRLAASDEIGRFMNDYDDPRYPWAMAKVPIRKGERIELAPALVLDRRIVAGTPLAALVYYWSDLTDDMQAMVRDLRRRGYYVVQYQGPLSNWIRNDFFESFQDSVILPSAGWIGRIVRVGGFDADGNRYSDHDVDANCYMNILPSNFHNVIAADVSAHRDLPLQQQQQKTEEKQTNETTSSSSSSTTTTTTTTTTDTKETPFSLGNAGIVLELIASRDIAVGELIRINLPLAGTFQERIALYKEMQRRGQVYTWPGHHDLSFRHQHQHQQQQSASFSSTVEQDDTNGKAQSEESSVVTENNRNEEL